MSFRGQAQYLRVYASGGADYQLWQNFYVNQTVTVSAKAYAFFPFTCDGISETSAISGRSIQIKFPATSLGYVARMNGSFTALKVELGSALAPIGAQIPPLTASNALVGVPLQI